MTLVIKIVLAIVVILALGVGALRIRKLRHDELRHVSHKVDRRLLMPPPSPYTPSKGFRLLDGSDPPMVRPEPLRPRLELEHQYVFSESQLPPLDESALAASRHDTQWALTRSGHRPVGSNIMGRMAIMVVVAVLLVGTVGYYLQHHPSKSPTTSVTSTTSAPASSTTTTVATLPTSFVATSHSGNVASYSVPLNKYTVTVNATAGAVWTVYRMGPGNTLEHQGTVPLGQSYSLELTGPSQIELGSPRNATVSVAGRPVALPSPLPAPLTLVFTPSTTPPG